MNDEWVYNEAEIDQAKVIWARDMNPTENCKLIGYFKDRRIWLLEVGMDEALPKLNPILGSLSPVMNSSEKNKCV